MWWGAGCSVLLRALALDVVGIDPLRFMEFAESCGACMLGAFMTNLACAHNKEKTVGLLLVARQYLISLQLLCFLACL